jgi:predicted amidohydrolase
MVRTLRVAATTIDVRLGEVEANLARVAEGLRACLRSGAELTVLPELATSGYMFKDAAEAAAAAIPRHDARLTALARLVPAGKVAVVGYCEAAAGGSLHNSALVLSGGEILRNYRKSHLWAGEKLIFAPGAEAGCVVDTPVGRLGLAICYDNEFPEVPRGLALAGADICALPVNWPKVPRPAGEHPPETIMAMAAARASRMPFVIADRAGQERGVTWTGATAIIDGDGWIAAESESRPVMGDIVLRPGDKVIGERNDLFTDRRPDLYR